MEPSDSNDMVTVSVGEPTATTQTDETEILVDTAVAASKAETDATDAKQLAESAESNSKDAFDIAVTAQLDAFSAKDSSDENSLRIAGIEAVVADMAENLNKFFQTINQPLTQQQQPVADTEPVEIQPDTTPERSHWYKKKLWGR